MCNDRGCRKQKSTVGLPTNILVLKRVTQTVRAIDPKTGNERFVYLILSKNSFCISSCQVI